MEKQQPNILLIHVDQHRYDCLGVNGHPAAVTPHLDRLAADGVNFTHACCPSPICMPARTSLLTGVYPTQHGCLANRGTEGYRAMDPHLATFGQVLKAGGYRLGYVGKWEVGTPAAPHESGLAARARAAATADPQRLVRRGRSGCNPGSNGVGLGRRSSDSPAT
jgi:arylsulfatase A-like enzyme